MKKPLTGNRYGRLVVVSFDRKENGRTYWKCKCDCGNERIVIGWSLTKRKLSQKSCGCLRNEILAGVQSRKRKPHGQAAITRMMGSYIRNARNKGRPFTLTREQFISLATGDCFYCGRPPQQSVCGFIHGDFIHNGIDRISSAGGYTPDNSRSCCKTCNIAKHTMDESEFIAWVMRVASHVSISIQKTAVADYAIENFK